jgi:arylsulfatase A-like enzyme
VLLGEHGWVGKRFDEIHDELSHVPFLIRHPAGKAAGRESKYFASTHDVGPTVLSVLGQEIPGHMDGVDLSPLLDGRKPGRARPYWTAAYNDHVAASDGRWLLISDNQGRRKRLYATSNEGVNVAGSHPQLVNRLWGYVKRDAGPKGLPDFR